MTTDYEAISSVIADGNIPVNKYRSKKTGLNVFIAEVEGPLVNGFFCLATEAHDDDGLPHTLEHLVFMGSEDYPYKGVLDLLANRCLASGTNAWTDTDHTCFTMTNAGSEGFLNLLPIYIDHILYPTLTESGYITEVHHINGDGEDAGVVYCEMQARENTGESRTHLEMNRALYPGQCGYKSETGGMMKNLRESTSHTKVCSYHREFYRPENLCLIITGQIKIDDVFKVLQPLEDKILSKAKLPTFARPWQSSVPPLEASIEKIVKYAADDETHGIVNIAWRGPPAKDQYTFSSVNMLLDYLTDSAISPLQRDFVEIPEPYCSNVEGNHMENAECGIYFKFDNVLTEKLAEIYPRLEDVLKKIGSGEEKIDMNRMYNLIHRKVLDALSSMEDNPHNKMAMCLIGDFLFGNNQADLEVRVQTENLYNKMKAEPETYWTGLVQKYFVDKNYVMILGQPSTSLREEYADEETDRVEKQQEELGKDGLQKKADILDKATEENEKPPPASVLTSVDIPDVSSINFHPIIPSCNRGSSQNSADDKNPAFPLDEIPFRFQLDDTHTNFVLFNVLLDSSCVPQQLKYYLPLFCEVIFESAIKRNGVVIPHEEVISELEADTLCTEACLGVKGLKFSCGNFPQVIMLKMQVEKAKYEKGVNLLKDILFNTQFTADRLTVVAKRMNNTINNSPEHEVLKVEKAKYEKGVNLLKDILFNTQFTAERLKVVAKRMNNTINKYKRKGNSVMTVLLKSILFTQECNHQINSMFRQGKFLEGLLKRLETEPTSVESEMEELRTLLTQIDNITVHMAVDVSQLTSNGNRPHEIWKTLVPDKGQTNLKGDNVVGTKMKNTFEYLLPLEESKKRSLICGVGSVESAYLMQVVPCVKSYLHEDLAAIEVFIQYLTQLEGPMWRQIRGLGLSYHYSMFVRPETGLLYFLLARSTHIVSAFKEGKNIVIGYVTGSEEFNDIELEAAKSSLTFEIIERETTVADVSGQSLLAYYRQVPHTYNKDYLKQIAAVKLSDLKCVGEKYMSALFDESVVRRAVCCSPAKVNEIVEALKEVDVQLEVVPTLDEDFLCAL